MALTFPALQEALSAHLAGTTSIQEGTAPFVQRLSRQLVLLSCLFLRCFVLGDTNLPNRQILNYTTILRYGAEALLSKNRLPAHRKRALAATSGTIHDPFSS